jgi:hypothetical protein
MVVQLVLVLKELKDKIVTFQIVLVYSLNSLKDMFQSIWISLEYDLQDYIKYEIIFLSPVSSLVFVFKFER